jgi:hypothetical protein
MALSPDFPETRHHITAAPLVPGDPDVARTLQGSVHMDGLFGFLDCCFLQGRRQLPMMPWIDSAPSDGRGSHWRCAWTLYSKGCAPVAVPGLEGPRLAQRRLHENTRTVQWSPGALYIWTQSSGMAQFIWDIDPHARVADVGWPCGVRKRGAHARKAFYQRMARLISMRLVACCEHCTISPPLMIKGAEPCETGSPHRPPNSSTWSRMASFPNADGSCPACPHLQHRLHISTLTPSPQNNEVAERH